CADFTRRFKYAGAGGSARRGHGRIRGSSAEAGARESCTSRDGQRNAMSGADGNTRQLLKSVVSRRRVLQIAGSCGMALETPRGVAQGSPSYEVVVYGATPAGVMAAVAAARVGSHVLLLEPGDFVGGMLVNGTPAAGLIPAGKQDLVG